MSKYTIKDWLEGRIGARCETREACLLLMDIAEKHGIKWWTGREPHELDDIFGELPNVINVMPEGKRMYFGYVGAMRTLEELKSQTDETDLADVPTEESK